MLFALNSSKTTNADIYTTLSIFTAPTCMELFHGHTKARLMRVWFRTQLQSMSICMQHVRRYDWMDKRLMYEYVGVRQVQDEGRMKLEYYDIVPFVDTTVKEQDAYSDFVILLQFVQYGGADADGATDRKVIRDVLFFDAVHERVYSMKYSVAILRLKLYQAKQLYLPEEMWDAILKYALEVRF